MSAKTHGVGVFLELRKRLRCGSLIIGKDVAANPADVTMTGGDSSLHILTPRGEVTLTLPQGFSYEEESCIPTAGDESCREELHFRLRISVSHDNIEETSDTIVKTLRAQETYCFYCQSCTTRLLEDRLFKRVLPLPNGNWNSLVDDWCCHPDPFAGKMLPRAEDCLLGDTFFLLARDGSCEETLLQEVSSAGAQDSEDPKKVCQRKAVVSCTSCSSVLGEALTPETLKLYITQVVVEPLVGDRKPDSLVNRSFFLERTVAARLAELSNSLNFFHFCVQTPNGKPFLLLWLLNSDSIIASIPQWSANPSTCLSSSLRAARALKLLYIRCSHVDVEQQEVITSWEVNATGHPVVLPLKVCEELLQVIDDSNATLPASMRHMRAYEVAYLRL
ncbi:E3 ubiquitin-protein ligase E3D [Nerophis lumbriciformis]|uniref:E3 ubiquitin-protein ligase E3D n=1 Tax=Nerophis lumbriciformis TaxID=546530 RepID=UPI002ADFFC88|nr:E3 ubiquitin-protein ligase E3D-like [Nerophis lumbriciformis]